MRRRYSIAVCIVFILSLLLNSYLVGKAYAQDAKKILSIEAFDMLNTITDTYLIDVRTRAEYQFVGHPRRAYLFPYMFMTNNFAKVDEKYEYQLSQKNKEFVEEISKAFKKTDNLLIICRDGARSGPAAKDLIDEGFKKVFHVADGFEGSEFPTFADDNRHKFYRNLAKTNKIYGYKHRRHYGWQFWGLPWTYEMDPKYIYPPDLRPAKK